MQNKIRRNAIVFLATLVLMFCFGACGNTTTTAADESNIEYTDYEFWEQENVLRITVPEITVEGIWDTTEGVTGTGELELKKKYLERTEVLKEAMISYFKEEYDIDITEKLEVQGLRAFKATGNNEGTMGYVDQEEPNILNLNQKLFGEYKILFDNTYVHETLHQIGFRSEEGQMITEGIVDSLTDLILKKAGMNSYPTPSYGETRQLAYQMLSADKGIVEFYLTEENPDIVSRINTVLESVERPLEKTQDVGSKLEYILEGLTYGIQTRIDPYLIAYEAQEIVRAYCQELEPSEEIIDYIRANYLVLEYEYIFIEEDVINDGYQFFVK